MKFPDRKAWIIAVVAVTAIPLAVSAILPRERGRYLTLNTTESMPYGLYVRAADQHIAPGAIVAFDAPALPRSLGWPTSVAFLKPVAAVAGATYCITTEATTVDGAVYDPPRRLDLSPTVPTPVGCATVPPEHVFVLSTVPGSYDSRYYGPVPVSLIQAVYEPLWTF